MPEKSLTRSEQRAEAQAKLRALEQIAPLFDKSQAPSMLVALRGYVEAFRG